MLPAVQEQDRHIEFPVYRQEPSVSANEAEKPGS